MKIFENKKAGIKRRVSLLGIELYTAEDNDEYREQHFLGGLFSAKRLKSLIKERKTYRIFNIPVIERTLENDVYKYYIFGCLVNKFAQPAVFYNKYLKTLNFEYDDVYILNGSSGEIYLFFAYLAKAFLSRNKSSQPLFVAAQNYHVDIVRLFYPQAKCILIKNLKVKTLNNEWLYNGHRFFILFSGTHFEQVEKDIKTKEIGEVHYFESILRTLNLQKSDISDANTMPDASVQNTMHSKVAKTGLNFKNFVILAPEALTCEELPVAFWERLAAELQERGCDIYLNLTTQNYNISGCKTADLDYRELLSLAFSAKAVISLRSGLSEFLLQTNIPNIAIYTRFRNRALYAFSIDKEIGGFTMKKLPFTKPELVKEINSADFESEEMLISEILKNFDSFFKSENLGSREECPV